MPMFQPQHKNHFLFEVVPPSGTKEEWMTLFSLSVSGFNYSISQKTITVDIKEFLDELHPTNFILNLYDVNKYVVTLYDPSGIKSKYMLFDGLSLIDHQSYFDYSDSNITLHEISTTYEKLTIIYDKDLIDSGIDVSLKSALSKVIKTKTDLLPNALKKSSKRGT